jgi:hypothetical protein
MPLDVLRCEVLRKCMIDGQPHHDTARLLHTSQRTACLRIPREKMACAVEPDNNNSSSALCSVHPQ